MPMSPVPGKRPRKRDTRKRKRVRKPTKQRINYGIANVRKKRLPPHKLVRRSLCCAAQVKHKYGWDAPTEDAALALICRSCWKLCRFKLVDKLTGATVWVEPGDRPLC